MPILIKGRRSWWGVFSLGLAIAILGMLLAGLSSYSLWRGLQSLGHHKFMTTGEVYTRVVSEKSTYRIYKRKPQSWAVFTTPGGKYRYDNKVSVTQKLRIRSGARYVLNLEVLEDRFGQVVVIGPEQERQPKDKIRSHTLIFLGVALFGVGVAGVSYRRLKRSEAG